VPDLIPSRLRGVAPDADCVAALTRYLWISPIIAVALEMLELLLPVFALVTASRLLPIRDAEPADSST
jgi:hypothetical protein